MEQCPGVTSWELFLQDSLQSPVPEKAEEEQAPSKEPGRQAGNLERQSP